MPFRFVGQPFPEWEQIGYVISRALRGHAGGHAWFATAWGKQSGLSRIARDVEGFRASGGYAEVIVGVDEGGATTEGLRLLVELFDAAYVFHDPGARTFHPKIYVVQDDDTAVAVVGSGNMTRGGLYANYEGSVVADLNLAAGQQRDFLEGVRAYYDRLLSLGSACKPLTVELIEGLADDPSVVLMSERRANRQRQRQRGQGQSSTFGSGAVPGLLGAPTPSIAPLPGEEDDADDALVPDATEGTESQQSDGAGLQPRIPRATLRWWKQLSVSDAHRKPPTSNQRNYVVLGQSGHEIDRETWFREELFGDLDWSAEPMHTGNVKEVAVVPFEVYIEDRHVGQYNLRVDHAKNRISNQGNAPTYMNWSGMLDVIMGDDYTGWWIELGQMADGDYRLRLLREEPG